MKTTLPIVSRRSRLLGLSALSFVALPAALLFGGCVAEPQTESEMNEQVGETRQLLTQCVTIRRGAGTVADATISKSSKNQNFGSQGSLKLEKDKKSEALLRFDLSAIPASAVVNSAKLKLYVPGDSGCDHDDDDDDDDHHYDNDHGQHHSQSWHHDHGDHDSATIAIHRATQTWTESGVTFNNFGQSFDAAVIGQIQTSSSSSQKTADVKSLVAAWVNGSKANQGFLLDTKSSRTTTFVSSENSSASLRPALEVCYTTPDNHCAPNPCQNGSTCQNTASAYTCACAPGYSGTNCQTNINECAGNPCQHGGACSDGVNSYTCACPAGWSGAQCQTNVNDCAPNPCQHGGVCTDGVNSHACACPAGYGGADCQTNINDCAGNPCQNGGTCNDGVNTYTCTCPAGFTGTQCQTNVDDCAGSTCQNGGTCIDGIASYICACAPGFTGVNCQHDIDECAAEPCLNDGECIDQVNGYVCACVPGYTGQHCDVDIDDCEPNPCVNGVCIDQVNDYECACVPGYTGVNCQHDIDECAAEPCLNDGECIDQVNGYVCACAPGYTGIDCDVNIDDCDPDPCLNDGVCFDQVDGYSCHCPPGFTYPQCQIEIDECESEPCLHGICEDLINSYSCACDPGWEGDGCDTPVGETCPAPSGAVAPLTPRQFGARAFVQGSLDAAAPSLLDGSCGVAGTPEAIYSFTAPATDTYHFQSAGYGGFGSWSGISLYALDEATCTELACVGGDFNSRADMTLTAGQTILLVFEGTPPPGNDFAMQLWSGCNCQDDPYECGYTYTCDAADVCHGTDHSGDPGCDW